jgi:DeoR family glycerol-3-phosphate regulon repressor
MLGMKPEQRRERIVDIVLQRERVSVDELADTLGSSRETIRRDLGLLADDGRIRKFHGGASVWEKQREGPFNDRMGEAVREKRAVAAAAAALFESGSTILVDVGTTTLMFAEALAGRTDVTVITNGLSIARILSEGGTKVFVIGGELRADTGEMVGTLAIEQIGRFYASHAVITVGGLSSRGAMDFDLDEAQIARAMISQARTLTVIADGSKLQRDALFQVCALDAIDRLVLDRMPGQELSRALEAAGVDIIIAAGPLPEVGENK